MTDAANLSRAKISDFLACSRRFQLRYLEQMPWPIVNRDPESERSMDLGQQFHTLLHRHFLRIPPKADELSEPDLKRWWGQFKSFEPRIPDGHAEAELTLTVPIGGLTLTGRFDLLVDTGDTIHIYDWKTFGRARTREQLRQDLQSRIYLAMVAESGEVLGRKIKAEEIILTYWFFSHPPVEVILPYGRREHLENWNYLTSIATEIERMLDLQGSWSLTEDYNECARCAYQIPCRRVQTGSEAEAADFADWSDTEDDAPIEPAVP